MLNLFGEAPVRTVFISEEQLHDISRKQLFGRYYEDTNIYSIFPDSLKNKGEFLGAVISENSEVDITGFHGRVIENKIEFYYGKEKIKTETYHIYQDIFSRNKGIIETDVMKNKRAVILGCGSVGSLAAVELARAGVGHFLLVDADILEYHNLCRHQCGIEDVGDLKINALERKILSINPFVHIEKCENIFQNIPKEMLDSFCKAGDTIFIGGADNRSADVYANRISIYYSCSFISIGLWERACAGEIFYHIPERNMPCYECALGYGDTTPRTEGNHHLYSNEETLNGISFEPGISVDINFVTEIGIKLAIDILNIGREGYQPRLLNDLRQYTIVCNTNQEKIGGEIVNIFSYPLQVSTSLMVTFSQKTCSAANCCQYENDPERGK